MKLSIIILCNFNMLILAVKLWSKSSHNYRNDKSFKIACQKLAHCEIIVTN